jgi:hypothetical protein
VSVQKGSNKHDKDRNSNTDAKHFAYHVVVFPKSFSNTRGDHSDRQPGKE